MFYKNARIFLNNQFRHGAFSVKNGVFHQVLPHEIPKNAVDLQGRTVIPGLVDIHVHGAAGGDFCDGSRESLCAMAAYLAKQGVTSFVPASVTAPYEVLEKAFVTARDFHAKPPAGCARLQGIHMEGPYFSPEKRGAQNMDYLRQPDFVGFKALYEAAGGLVRLVDVAPELPGGLEFIRKASALCTVGIAHTDADYETAKAAIGAGARHLTHLFNAMPPIHHRQPGVIGAVCEAPGVRAELICDGHHVHPSAVRMAFAMFGAERMVLVSDGLQCMGCPEGQYALGGQPVFLKEGAARLSGGTLAGSATDLFSCMRLAMGFGIPEADCVRAVTVNPALAAGITQFCGTIAPGRPADFIICRPDYTDVQVYLAGKPL